MKKGLKYFVILVLSMAMFLQVGCTNQKMQEKANSDVASNEKEYTYRDVIVDRSIVEGKFACYFFRSDSEFYQADGTRMYSGDSTLLIAPDGTTVMIDCNSMPDTARVVDYLQRMGIEKIDHFIVSHSDWDHYAGYAVLLRYVEIGCVYTNGYPAYTTEGTLANKFMKAVEEKGIPTQILREGDVLEFGGATTKVYWPPVDTEWKGESEDPMALNENTGSLALKVVYGESSFMFTSDLYVGQENILARKYGKEMQSDVEKMGHHGLNTSCGINWINTVNSKIAVAMYNNVANEGIWNSYQRRGGVTMNTGLDGTCLIYTSGDGTYDVQVEKERESTTFGELDTEDGHFRVE